MGGFFPFPVGEFRNPPIFLVGESAYGNKKKKETIDLINTGFSEKKVF